MNVSPCLLQEPYHPLTAERARHRVTVVYKSMASTWGWGRFRWDLRHGIRREGVRFLRKWKMCVTSLKMTAYYWQRGPCVLIGHVLCHSGYTIMSSSSFTIFRKGKGSVGGVPFVYCHEKGTWRRRRKRKKKRSIKEGKGMRRRRLRTFIIMVIVAKTHKGEDDEKLKRIK